LWVGVVLVLGHALRIAAVHALLVSAVGCHWAEQSLAHAVPQAARGRTLALLAIRLALLRIPLLGVALRAVALLTIALLSIALLRVSLPLGGIALALLGIDADRQPSGQCHRDQHDDHDLIA